MTRELCGKEYTDGALATNVRPPYNGVRAVVVANEPDQSFITNLQVALGDQVWRLTSTSCEGV